eukprot:NODE_19189_length_855_cov_4.391484.p7 GENE.NODE_19189_length_855_cov_4.391484~~NODE_19189_length_855_cov_4.391484.p7  ORF type:complete len:55 (-),score=17.53 NODE_19189_length_855_cov_4.391484:569-733(-)
MAGRELATLEYYSVTTTSFDGDFMTPSFYQLLDFQQRGKFVKTFVCDEDGQDHV